MATAVAADQEPVLFDGTFTGRSSAALNFENQRWSVACVVLAISAYSLLRDGGCIRLPQDRTPDDIMSLDVIFVALPVVTVRRTADSHQQSVSEPPRWSVSSGRDGCGSVGNSQPADLWHAAAIAVRKSPSREAARFAGGDRRIRATLQSMVSSCRIARHHRFARTSATCGLRRPRRGAVTRNLFRSRNSGDTNHRVRAARCGSWAQIIDCVGEPAASWYRITDRRLGRSCRGILR